MACLPSRFPLALAFALTTACQVASAQAAAPRDSVHFFTWENDSHFLTDRFYTSGVQLSTKHAADRRGVFAREATHALCRWLACDAGRPFTSQRNIGQLIFTPRDITVSHAQPLDRPWAGFLYHETAYAFLSGDRTSITTLSGQIGVTGPLSLAEPAQKAFHRMLDRPRPMGWHNQIGSSLSVNIGAERRRARPALSFDLPGGVRFNTASYWRIAAGTYQTFAGIGLAAVMGKNLPPVSPAPPGIGNSATANPVSPVRAATCLVKWLQCTAFASVEGRLVAYNLLLDGRPWRDDPDVDKRSVVYEVALGNRIDFVRTGTASRGPLFLQTKITRKSAEFRSPLPVPSHSVYALTFGREF